ncbi:MAG: nucleotidyl transferase AbiEii/AbiGii toxin family protein [Candidatus Atribacteria bacterium]|nr:nucleotidyl transferase AbiEii/AbiGii toxin family protein [Candidatus Atribacteria bacterium]
MQLYLSSVSNLLWKSLIELMKLKELENFRLVGGTNLSLQLGHRESVDIDMYTDAEYGSIDFLKIEEVLREKFSYIDSLSIDIIGMGKSFFIGNEAPDLVKLDLFYTDNFVFPLIEVKGVRFASIEEIAAMKLDVIGRGGRKKDFWDFHELLGKFSLNEMIDFYIKRYPYNLNREEIIRGLTNFEKAEYEFTPICFKDKVWEIIKLDIEELVKN